MGKGALDDLPRGENGRGDGCQVCLLTCDQRILDNAAVRAFDLVTHAARFRSKRAGD